MSSRGEEIAALLSIEDNTINASSTSNSNYGSITINTSSSTDTTSISASETTEQPNTTTTQNQESIHNDTESETNNDFLSRTRQRLRCLFILFTCPIIPLATALTILLIYIVYLSLFLPKEECNCSEPLRLYAFLSAVVFLYTPHHNRIKRYISSLILRDVIQNENYNRSVQSLHRIYDHLYLTFCLAYIYIGVEWTENCRMMDGTNALVPTNNSTASDEVDSNSFCNCPLLYHATRYYVLTLCALTTVLALPLLCLPCVYFWIVRGAAADAALSHISTTSSCNIDDILNKMQILTSSSQECCICMMEFDYTNNKIIQTKCNHVFHYDCLKGWMDGGGMSNTSTGRNLYRDSSRRSCPLCRTDLVANDLV